MTANCTVVFGYTVNGIEMFAGVVSSAPHELRRVQQEIARTYGRIPYGFEGDVALHRSTSPLEQVHVVVYCDLDHSVAVAVFDDRNAAQQCAEEEAQIGREARIVTTTMGHLDPEALRPRPTTDPPAIPPVAAAPGTPPTTRASLPVSGPGDAG